MDRLEINAGIAGVKDMRALLAIALGPKAGRVCKTEYVYFDDKGVVISLSRIGKKLYLEIESTSLSKNLARSLVIRKKIKMTREPKSLFELHVKEKL